MKNCVSRSHAKTGVQPWLEILGLAKAISISEKTEKASQSLSAPPGSGTHSKMFFYIFLIFGRGHGGSMKKKHNKIPLCFFLAEAAEVV